jgi:hypothetical protein
MHNLSTCLIIEPPIDILMWGCGLSKLLNRKGVASANRSLDGADLSEYQFFLVVYKKIPHIR